MAQTHGPSPEARAARLGHRLQAPNSLGRRVMVVMLGAIADTLLPLLDTVREEARREGRRGPRVAVSRDGAGCRDAMEMLRDMAGDGLDQVIVITRLEHDIAETEPLCARCVQEGIKIGAILVGDYCPGVGGGRTAVAARHYAETIAVVHDPETAVEILRAIGG